MQRKQKKQKQKGKTKRNKTKSSPKKNKVSLLLKEQLLVPSIGVLQV
jgi:hypothetical protein